MSTNRDAGFALVMTVLVVVIVGSLVAAATLIGSNHIIINNYYDRQSELELAADGALEWARSELNAKDALYPDSGYVVLEDGVSITDGAGNTIPGVRRWLYAGPTGQISGQYGVFGSIVAVLEEAGGGRLVRRSQVYQESFSKYAYFTDVEPSFISFGAGDQIFGPVHSNSPIKIYAPTGGDTATFHGPVRTASAVPSPQYGIFAQGYQEHVPRIPMPSTADLDRLKVQAAAGGTAFVGTITGANGTGTTRVEFVAVDLNGDGDESDADEGFIRVYQSADANWVTGVSNEEASDQCGDYHAGVFVSTNAHPADGHGAVTALRSSTGRCYLGGHDSISGGFSPTDARGGWLANPDPVHPRVAATGRADAAYLIPITRALNPDFKGVIHVEGRVVVSGRLRGRVTVAATDDIVFGDDLTYVTDPSAGNCEDIAGYFSGDDVIVANNDLNAPQDVSGGYETLDDTPDEFFHGTVLALGIFTVQDYSSGARRDEPCQGRTWGRGCLFLTGGIIQTTRGAVGTTAGTGYLKRYAYDPCGATDPPPYFPTTGVFLKGQHYQVDASGFDIDDYFSLIAAN